MNTKFKYADCEFYSIEMNPVTKEKTIHIWGYIYHSGVDEEKPYRNLEYTGFIVPLKEFLSLDYDYDSMQETRNSYVSELTEIDAIKCLGTYRKSLPLPFEQITEDTPCGEYVNCAKKGESHIQRKMNNAADEAIAESDKKAKVRKYCPMFEDDFLLIDNQFDDELGLAFADKHHFNVKFTDTGSSTLAKIMLMFAQKDYQIEVIGEPSYAPDGLQLADKPVILFRKEWKDSGKEV